MQIDVWFIRKSLDVYVVNELIDSSCGPQKSFHPADLLQFGVLIHALFTTKPNCPGTETP